VIVFGLALCAVCGTPVLGAAAFSRERRQGSLGFLLATPLTSSEIAAGKVLGAAAPVLLAIGAFFPVAGLLAALTLSPVTLWSWLVCFGWLVVAALLGSALGIWSALLIYRESNAQLVPLLTMLAVQTAKLWVAIALYFQSGGDLLFAPLPFYTGPILLLYLLEAALAAAAWQAATRLLGRRRSQDIAFATEG
jgi:ABC-type transport system involved in multi-copper enzyme maturation permease subunit